eukprot:TRINITY_DN5751_c0_g1_i1.p1 TRINITY_DN5751_c0_g1~~TRINITY_DN5751_c0_g1_i1.p1  ORF type:complete len:726 (+),score=150.41 TRINITY_DN5751_c0_g1_i1:86-2179(+)
MTDKLNLELSLSSIPSSVMMTVPFGVGDKQADLMDRRMKPGSIAQPPATPPKATQPLRSVPDFEDADAFDDIMDLKSNDSTPLKLPPAHSPRKPANKNPRTNDAQRSRKPAKRQASEKPMELAVATVEERGGTQRSIHSFLGGGTALRQLPFTQLPLTDSAVAEVLELRELSEQYKRDIRDRDDKLQQIEQQTQAESGELKRLCADLERENAQLKQRQDQAREFMQRHMKRLAQLEREETDRRIAENTLKLGHISVERVGAEYREKWNYGVLFTELDRHKDEMEMQHRRLQEQQTALKTKSKPTKKRGTKAEATSPGEMGPPPPRPVVDTETIDQLSIVQFQLKYIEAQLKELDQQRESLEQKKTIHMRELKKRRDQASSKFSDFPVLHERYMLGNMLGRGGFSEVYSAYDLVEARSCACKIHQLNEQWPEDKKANYVKHALREYDIHKSLNHPRIVRLFDVFPIDNNCFVTVLELCEGYDLDFYLKQKKTLDETEARLIITQLCRALQYLNEQPQPIIHYDLKPGNILLNHGEIKLTDFGLSKIMEFEAADIELTSQGAGTYWYLPPETFDLSGRARISSKVDVWSVGVIFFQMLYGRRPFGDGMSQQKILQEQAIIRDARNLEFPTTKNVSAAAKEFIRRCLTYHQYQRPDVKQLVEDPFLHAPLPGAKKKASATAATTPAAHAAIAQTAAYSLI